MVIQRKSIIIPFPESAKIAEQGGCKHRYKQLTDGSKPLDMADILDTIFLLLIMFFFTFIVLFFYWAFFMMKGALPSSRTATTAGENQIEFDICDVCFVGSPTTTVTETRHVVTV